MKPHSILIFQQIVPNYRVPVFKKLHEELGALLCHSTHNRNSKINTAADKINFPNVVIPNKDFFGTWQKVIPTLQLHQPKIVIAGVAATNFTFLKLLFLKPFFRYKLIAWGHGVHNKEIQTPLRGFRGRLMKFYFRQSNAVLFYSEERKHLVTNRMPRLKPKCFVAYNTLDISKNKSILHKLQQKSKTELKRELGANFSAPYNIIFIGRLLPDKGIGLLLEATKILSSKVNIHLHIVGDGPEEGNIKSSPLHHKKIFTYGGIYNENINGQYLYASDLFVMPGYVGLSVIHAFSYGLPVVTCRTGKEGPFHSPEIEYLIDEKNGVLCNHSPQAIAQVTERLLKNKPERDKMSQVALKTAYETCSLNRMVKGFKETVHYVNM